MPTISRCSTNQLHAIKGHVSSFAVEPNVGRRGCSVSEAKGVYDG